MLTRSLKRMAEIAVARDRRSVTVGGREPGFAVLALLHFAWFHVESDLLRIEVTQAHTELRGPLGSGHEHPVERGHRTVVKVGRGRPDAVQRASAIVRLPVILWLLCVNLGPLHVSLGFLLVVGTIQSRTPERLLMGLRHTAIF